MVWDDPHLKALLHLPRYPKRLLEQEPYASWLRERGGLSAVRLSLRKAPLKPILGQLLEMILSGSSTPPFRRAAALHVSQSTYFRYLDALIAALLDYLNGTAAEEGAEPVPATNLPIPLTPLIGAEPTLEQITASLLGPTVGVGVRLVTLMGAGGIGKTRLAVQAARRILENETQRQTFRDGIFWVDLAPLRTPELVLVEIARVLNLAERGGDPTLELLQRELYDRSLLLLLDNFEHLLEAAPLLAALLRGTRQLKVLVTSRAALNISGEHRLAIPPLELPGLHPLPDLEQLGNYSAVQLFVQRAKAIDRSFALTAENAPDVVRLCTAFDGLPLALEMAARRASYLSPQKMLTMLGQRLHLLTGGAPDAAPRHQNLRNLIDWSYQLLDSHQQLGFQRLAVFANGWTLEAMEAVCTDLQTPTFDILAALLNQSIVFRQAGDHTPRFGMLETIREYAQEKLSADEEALIRQRHAAYYLSLIQPVPSIKQLEDEYHNLRNALQWAIEQNHSELALDLGLSLWHYWMTRGSSREGQYWLARVLAVASPLRSAKRMRALIAMGELVMYQNDFQQARVYYEQMAALAQELESRNDLGVALQGLGDVAQFTGDYPRARALYSDSLALYRETNLTRGVGWALDRLGNLALEQGALAEAFDCYTESLRVFESDTYPEGIAHARAKLGLIALDEHRYADAVELFENSLAHLRPINANWQHGWLIEYLGQAVLGLGDLPRAAELFRQSLTIHFEGNAYQTVAYSLHGLANVALAEGQGTRAARLLSGVQMIYERHAPIPSRRRQLEASVARCREALDPLSFSVAWHEGQGMTMEQIVAEGLDVTN